ncbi:MAG TPA: gliding motility-associated C-terminal domain-containing protein [Flavobacteriales bacterium]|nr:gliding motility-associated C-terminal domain-containing protein [Flavobacteriales bacterium]
MAIEQDTIFSNCPHTFTINRTFIATDNCDNEAIASQVIEVSDTEAPVLTTPLDFVVECGVEVQLENAIAIDHCDASPFVEIETDTVNIQSTGTFTIIRTFTASDACGNIVTGDQTIYLQDTSPPFFTTFPPDLLLQCGESFPEDMPVFQDGCDPSPILSNVTTDENYQDCANESVVSRTFEIEDDAGNTFSQTQTITFIDDSPPFFTFVPSDITAGCTNEIEITDPEYDDLCSANGLTLTTVFDEQYLGCEEMYDQTRIYTITDACGLTASANVTIFIRDTTAPLLETELDSLSFYCSYNVPSCEQMFSDLVFVDECGSEELSYSCSDILIEGDCEEQACLWERTYFWEDGCGNQSQASHVIRVEETAFSPTMPTGMTPNGDGANDAYVILDIGPLIAVGEVAPCDWIDNTLFRVINRWGQIVFEETNYRNDWEGTYTDGSPLPSGTYFIVFEANGEAFSTYVDIRR